MPVLSELNSDIIVPASQKSGDTYISGTISISSLENYLNQNLNNHINNASHHISDEERNAWNKAVTTLEAFLKDDTDYFVLFFDKAYTTPRKIQVKTSFNMNDMNLEKQLVLQKSRGAKLYSPKETIERAKSRIGETKYNLLLNLVILSRI